MFVIAVDGKTIAKMSFMRWLFRYNSDLNYKWIIIFYLTGSLAAVFLYMAEKFEVEIDFIDNLEGVYVVFVPYIPCLLWTCLTVIFHQRSSSITADKKNL